MAFDWELQVAKKFDIMSCRSNVDLKNGMLFLFKTSSASVEQCLQSAKSKKAEKLCVVLKSYMYKFHHYLLNEETTDVLDESKVNFYDIMAAFLSSIIELKLLIVSKKPNSKDQVFQEIFVTTWFFLSSKPAYIWDVIVQTSAFKKKSPDNLELIERLFDKTPRTVATPQEYLKFLAAFRYWKRSSNKTTYIKVLEFARTIQPPPKFSKWLRRLGIENVPDLPKDCKAKHVIKAFFDTKLSKEIWNRLLSTLEFNCEEDSNEQQRDPGLFFIDNWPKANLEEGVIVDVKTDSEETLWWQQTIAEMKKFRGVPILNKDDLVDDEISVTSELNESQVSSSSRDLEKSVPKDGDQEDAAKIEAHTRQDDNSSEVSSLNMPLQRDENDKNKDEDTQSLRLSTDSSIISPRKSGKANEFLVEDATPEKKNRNDLFAQLDGTPEMPKSLTDDLVVKVSSDSIRKDSVESSSDNSNSALYIDEDSDNFHSPHTSDDEVEESKSVNEEESQGVVSKSSRDEPDPVILEPSNSVAKTVGSEIDSSLKNNETSKVTSDPICAKTLEEPTSSVSRKRLFDSSDSESETSLLVVRNKIPIPTKRVRRHSFLDSEDSESDASTIPNDHETTHSDIPEDETRISDQEPSTNIQVELANSNKMNGVNDKSKDSKLATSSKVVLASSVNLSNVNSPTKNINEKNSEPDLSISASVNNETDGNDCNLITECEPVPKSPILSGSGTPSPIRRSIRNLLKKVPKVILNKLVLKECSSDESPLRTVATQTNLKKKTLDLLSPNPGRGKIVKIKKLRPVAPRRSCLSDVREPIQLRTTHVCEPSEDPRVSPYNLRRRDSSVNYSQCS